ncbi:MAG: DUF4202 family protein [Patescibacteria group bacterium]
MLERIKQFVQESFNKKESGKSMAHFERALDWLLVLKPDADEAMQIAAYAHDVERVFRQQTVKEVYDSKQLNDPDVLRNHQDKGAKIIGEYLRSEGYDEVQVQRVENIVQHHEEGGDSESDLIKDADSLSYLEINAPKNIDMFPDVFSKDQLRVKIDWMYNRISSDKAKRLAEPYYKKAIEMLEQK